MNKTGLYIVRKTEQTPEMLPKDEDYTGPDQHNCTRVSDVLMSDGREVAAVTVSNNKGAYFGGNNNTDLILDDKVITKDITDSKGIKEINDTLRLGSVDLDRGSGECINITLANYNKLQNGETVSGDRKSVV